MAVARTETLLSLDRFARILGINPAHFAGGRGADIFPTQAHCGEVYPQFAWQIPESIVSREEVALAIFSAEQDIKRQLGYSPAPVWECGEMAHYNAGRRFHNPPVKVRWGKLIAGGRRAVEFIQSETVVYEDLDGDGFNETARVNVLGYNLVTAYANYPHKEIKVYFEDQGGSAKWEIRYPRSSEIVGDDLVMLFDSWLFFKPSLTHAPTTNVAFEPVNIEDPLSYVTDVEVWREYNDTEAVSAQLFPAGCEWDTTDTCLAMYNRVLGFVYPSTAGGGMDAYCDPLGRNSLDMRMWYRAGAESCEYENGTDPDPLDDYWAQTIAWMAAARLDKPLCHCTNVQEVARELQRNTVAHPDNGGDMARSYNLLDNPFGLRVGEIRGWNRVRNMANEQLMDAGVF